MMQTSSMSSHTPYTHLQSPERTERLRLLKQRLTRAESRIKYLQSKIKQHIDSHSVSLDEEAEDNIHNIFVQNIPHIKASFSEDSFTRLFWEEQERAFTHKDQRQMRWHPMIIKWCLYIKLKSSGAYGALRQSGVLRLPSERTLRDYTHVFKAKEGVQQEVTEQLKCQMKFTTLQVSLLLKFH